jgi:FdhE protein
MMNIEDIIQERPYLKETLLLYKRVKEFNDSIAELYRNSMHEGEISYPPSIVDGIFQRFSDIFDIPLESLHPLIDAMRLGQIDLTRLSHNEVSGFLLPYNEDELWMLLFIIGRPFSLGMRRLLPLDDPFYQQGRCPVCNSIPSIASIEGDGKRRLYCSFCGTSGHYSRIGCPACLNEGFRINTCDACGSYLKTVDASLLNDLSVDLADLISLPLDIIAQRKGFKRRSPNPIGIISMI